MTQAAKAQEPSMEEILASIRRIIADDDAPKAAPPPKPQPSLVSAPPSAAPDPVPPSPPEFDTAPAPTVETDILDLTEQMTKPDPSANFQTIDAQPDVIFSDPEPEPSPAPSASPIDEARRQFAETTMERSILSSTTSAAVDSAFNTLAQTVLVQNARTLEDLVREMLRPMLKTWLDDNLPSLVERLVRAEIERVSRGRGG